MPNNVGLVRISLQPVNMLPEVAAHFRMEPAVVVGPGIPPAPQESYLAAARRHLETAFREAAPAGFAAEEGTPAVPPPELVEDALTESPLTGTTVAAFKQTHRGVPIYGAAVGVEMSPTRALLDISGHLTPGPEVSPFATLAPATALSKAREAANLPAEALLEGLEAPQLNYWFDDLNKNEWRLVYIFSPIPAFSAPPREARNNDNSNEQERGILSKVVVDAHSGERVAIVPVRHNLTAVPARGLDADGTEHNFTASQVGAHNFVLEDPVRRIKTYTMDFSDINCGPKDLPGDPVTSTTSTFAHAAAVVAHANATHVYDFFLTVFQRNGIDGHGMELTSAVECLDYRANQFGTCNPANPAVREYQNAAWIRDNRPQWPAVIRNGMMVYGQTRWPDGKLHSYAESLDVVGHELTHGITDYSGGLDYETESGALNESYSDIFGAAISNADRVSVAAWDWSIGEELSPTGEATRSLADPAQGDPPQPAHMNDFIRLQPGEAPGRNNDQGYVHYNSGIHNKAAYNLFQRPEFTWQQVVQMFYLTLTLPGRLHPRAKFADSLTGMVASCNSIFHADPTLSQKIAAVRAAFNSVGIT